MSKCKMDRKRLVLCVKDMNVTLGLKPKIATKDSDGNPYSEDDIAKNVIKYAKGWDDKKGKPDKTQAVDRESDALSDETWAVLEELGAVEPEAKPEKKGKKSDKGEEKKGKKEGVAAKGLDTSKKSKIKEPVVRTGGRIPKDWKQMKADLEQIGDDAALSRKYDKMLLTAQTLGEHMKEAEGLQKKAGAKLSVISHIRYRYEVNGYEFKDKRKYQGDEDGLVQLIGIDPSSAGRKMDLPAANPANKKAEKKADKSEKKADKKADKKAEKSDKKADKKGDKKSKK